MEIWGWRYPHIALLMRATFAPTSSREELPQLERIGRRGAFLIVIEIDENIAALFVPARNAFGPVLKNLGAIMALVSPAGSMAPHIDKIGRAFPRRRGVMVV